MRSLTVLCWQALDEKTQQAMMAYYHKRQQQEQVRGLRGQHQLECIPGVWACYDSVCALC